MPDDLPELLTGGGPHNDKELKLMLAGEKPLATFSDLPGPDTVLPTAAYAPHVASGAITMAAFDEQLSNGGTLRHESYAQPGERWCIEHAFKLSQTRYSDWCKAASDDC